MGYYMDDECMEVPRELSFGCPYESFYEVIETRKHVGNDTWSQTITLTFRSALEAFRYVNTTHRDADNVEPLIYRELDSQKKTQIGYIFRYNPLRESGSPHGDEISVTIRRITRSSPIEEHSIPRILNLRNPSK